MNSPAVLRTRSWVLVATALVAMNMYLDRACLGQLNDRIRADFDLAEWQTDWVLGAFFWSYALAQVPAAALGARFGFRHMLALYLVLWSLFTAGVGLAIGFASLLVARLLVGLAEAGAYPSAAAILRGWFPLAVRGRASSAVALGGRLGWAAAQLLTPTLVLVGAALGVPGWRFALWLYCGFGLLIAVFFWLVVRDTPAEHPACAADSASDSSPSPAPVAAPPLALAGFVRSRNLALFSLVQFGTNVGWAFLITQLPTFLTERFGVSESSRGAMASVPAWVSCIGLLLGGFVTDALARRLGVRRGRAWPIGGMMLVAAAAYLLCPLVRDPWSFVAMMALMGLAVDLANPSIWSFAQDVGGRHAGAVLGWGNMWGNIGAALSPVLLGAVKRAWGWDAAFLVASVCFALAALAAFSLDASKALRPDRA